MINISMIGEDKFRGILFQIMKRITRVEKGKSIEMRKDEKNEKKEVVKRKVSRWNKFGLVAFLT